VKADGMDYFLIFSAQPELAHFSVLTKPAKVKAAQIERALPVFAAVKYSLCEARHALSRLSGYQALSENTTACNSRTPV